MTTSALILPPRLSFDDRTGRSLLHYEASPHRALRPISLWQVDGMHYYLTYVLETAILIVTLIGIFMMFVLIASLFTKVMRKFVYFVCF